MSKDREDVQGEVAISGGLLAAILLSIAKNVLTDPGLQPCGRRRLSRYRHAGSSATDSKQHPFTTDGHTCHAKTNNRVASYSAVCCVSRNDVGSQFVLFNGPARLP